MEKILCIRNLRWPFKRYLQSQNTDDANEYVSSAYQCLIHCYDGVGQTKYGWGLAARR